MKPNQWSQNDNRKLVKSSQVKSKKKKKCHTLWKKPSLLVYSLVPTTKSHRFFLIGAKMDLENKVTGFQFEQERSIYIQSWRILPI